jgi:F-type H+-transporting ATPase subunit c
MFKYFVNALCLLLLPVIAFAEESTGNSGSLTPGIAFGLAAIGGTLGQAKAVSSFLESAGRNPGAIGSMVPYLIVGLVFIETLVIFGFVIAYISIS